MKVKGGFVQGNRRFPGKGSVRGNLRFPGFKEGVVGETLVSLQGIYLQCGGLKNKICIFIINNGSH